uniref:ShKT domain-containing protein n=1 Tax=Strongyloides venezuelensis TaxID=75913 RepID=A0A0K0FTS3_STRVS
MNLKYVLLSTIFVLSINKAFGAEVGVGQTCDGAATTCATGYYCAPWGQAAPNNGNACAKECTVATQDTDCGTSNVCEAVTVGGTDLVCKSVLAALTSAPCTKTTVCDTTKEVCDEYTLKCVAKPVITTIETTVDTSTTTFSSTTTGNIINNVTPTPCVDLVVGGPNDCRALAPYCTNDIYKDLMKAKCPKTCGYCATSSGVAGGSGCRDSSSDCSSKQYLCRNSIYKDFMKRECPMTCGYC